MTDTVAHERILKGRDNMDPNIYAQYCAILRKELVPALGCTEPIAIAYAAAKAREVLGCMPEHIVAQCSGNIIKNVKGVIVPTTGDMRGVDTSAVLGTVGGDPSRELEVLSNITAEHLELTKRLLAQRFCQVELAEGVSGLLIVITAYCGSESAVVEIKDAHTNIARIEKNGQVLLRNRKEEVEGELEPNYNLLSLQGIYDFCRDGDISEILPILKEQERCNTAVAQEGLERLYGQQVGATLQKYYGEDVKNRARYMAAAGSDARMGGCVLPVVINSGSGNQGLTACMPVLVYAEDLNVSQDMKYRALAFSNLVGIHIKHGIGKLSAFCGAVSAACGSGAAITFLSGGDLGAIVRTVTNTLGNTTGIVCDGAKASCAAKIASALDAALLGHLMAMEGHVFRAGEGIVVGDVEDTIANVARVGRDGMHTTDIEILNIMIGN